MGDWLRAFVFQADTIERPDLDLSFPEQYGLSKSRSKIIFILYILFSVCFSRSEHFFIENSGEKIGAWFLQPEEDKAVDNNNVGQ